MTNTHKKTFDKLTKITATTAAECLEIIKHSGLEDYVAFEMLFEVWSRTLGITIGSHMKKLSPNQINDISTDMKNYISNSIIKAQEDRK